MNILCICGDWSEDYELAVPYHFLGHWGILSTQQPQEKPMVITLQPAFMTLTQNIKP